MKNFSSWKNLSVLNYLQVSNPANRWIAFFCFEVCYDFFLGKKQVGHNWHHYSSKQPSKCSFIFILTLRYTGQKTRSRNSHLVGFSFSYTLLLGGRIKLSYFFGWNWVLKASIFSKIHIVIPSSAIRFDFFFFGKFCFDRTQAISLLFDVSDYF